MWCGGRFLSPLRSTSVPHHLKDSIIVNTLLLFLFSEGSKKVDRNMIMFQKDLTTISLCLCIIRLIERDTEFETTLVSY